VDLSGYSIGSGGTAWTTTVYQLSGTLPPGGCAVVGGPNSSETNYSPVFLLSADFNPDIQNSGDTADGVGLFAMTAEEISDDSVPVDAVLYGKTNTSGLVDETGQAGAVDVNDASSGSSIARTGEGWIVQPAPTPNDCSHVK
jgi:hypothetical protein